MKKRILLTFVAAVAAVSLMGCGTTTTTTETTEETGVTSPVVKATEQYDEVISQLNSDQWYAFADINKDYDVLLVADGTYDNLDGNMVTIDATLYGLDDSGKPFELGTVQSSGTAYPLAVYNQCIMYGGNHCMSMSFVDGGSMITKLYADEIFDSEGNATYSVFDYDEHFEGNVDDDTKLKEMYEMYGQATVINFTQAQ